jgi:hypothetical protein
MTLALFRLRLREVTVEAAGRSAQVHVDDPIYGYGLFTSDGYGYISDCVFSKHGLSQVVKEYQAKNFYPDEAAAYRALKWSPCDSPYQLENEHLYDECCHLLGSLWDDARQKPDEYGDSLFRDLNAIFIETLQVVRDLNLFDSACVFSVFAGDQSSEARVVNADRLNSAEVCSAFESELYIRPLKLAKLRTTRWPTDESYEA